MTSSPSSSTFCGHHDPPGLLPSHCLSPSHYCCPSSGLSLDHCNSPLTGGLAFRPSPFRSCTARPLVRTPVSSKAPSSLMWFFTTWSSSTFQLRLLPCATHTCSSTTHSSFLSPSLSSCCPPTWDARLPLSTMGLPLEDISAT